MESKSLASLPDDLVLDIIDYLDTARDVAHLGRSNRRCHDLIQQDGWRAFVRSRFSSLTIPANNETRWSTVAQRLTYLDRCWEKRGFWMNMLSEQGQQGKFHRRPTGGQSVLFHAVVDARLCASQKHELVAVGAGENLLVGLKPESSQEPEVWHQCRGKDHGYQPGSGDVTAVSVIERGGLSEIVVGRANGDVRVLSAENGFTQRVQRLLPVGDEKLNYESNPMKKSPGQLAVSWTEWQPMSNLLANTKGSLLTIHNLAGAEETELSPAEHYDFSSDGEVDEASLLRSIKFMGSDVMACALGGSREPLRWGKMTPAGLQFFNAANNPRPLEDAALLTEVRYGEKTTVRAIEPVGGGGNENLLLSAWDDGTYRLVDIRTPSPQDAVYRDRFQPYEAGSSLLVYGTERFIAGSNLAPDVRLFDFRCPKPYSHTTVLPCSTARPFPAQKHDDQVWYNKGGPSWDSPQCEPHRGIQCPWHRMSSWDYWRPDATIHIGNSTYDRIYSLAKASDMSSTVYCGLRGAVLEMSLVLTDDALAPRTSHTAPLGWRRGRPGGKISLIETGVSLVQAPEWRLEDRGVPELMMQQPILQKQEAFPQERVKMHRLDTAFHRPRDFGETIRIRKKEA